MSKNKIKGIIDIIFAEKKNFSLENRLLISSSVVGILISLLGAIISFLIATSQVVFVTSLLLFVLLSLTYYFVRTKSNFTFLKLPIVFISIIGVSVIWVFDGGINGSILFPGLVVLMLGLIIVPAKKKKYVISFFIASVVSIYLIQLYNPSVIVDLPSEKVRWIDSFITVIYCSIVIFWIINFIHSNYTYEKERAERNAEELRDLVATKDKLFSIIAHDLRSPFNNIIGLSELLLKNEEVSNTSECKMYAGLINSSATSTLVLLDNLLNWAKSQTNQLSYNPKKIVLSSLINEVVKTSNSLMLQKNISLKIIEGKEIEVYTDENMINIILRNLISNAIKYTKPGGQIKIGVIRGFKQFEVSIADNGVGMNEEKIKTLFNITSNKTSPGTENEKGSGLGLVLCKEFVEKLGGKIWVESEEGKGSIFKFNLPLHSNRRDSA